MQALKCYQEICKNKEKHAKLCQILIRQSEKNLDEKKPKTEVCNDIPDFQNLVPRQDMCKTFPLPQRVGQCRFGDVFLERVMAWATKLRWPKNPTGCVSLLELYVDYTIHTGTLAPVPTSYANDKRVQTYMLKDLHPEAKVVTQTLGEQSIIWARFLKWSNQNGIKFWEYDTMPPSNCLNHVGYSLRTPAIANRPIFVTGVRPMILLHKLFHSPSGKRRTLDIA